MAGYDIRYSTSPIDETQLGSGHAGDRRAGPAAPRARPDRYTVTGLTPSTTYYFAIKSFDYAEPANVSAMSNVASGTTLPPIVAGHRPQPLADQRPRRRHATTSPRWPPPTSTPTRPTASSPPANNQAKAINIYNNQKRRLYHWADEPPSGGNDRRPDLQPERLRLGPVRPPRQPGLHHRQRRRLRVRARSASPSRTGIYEVNYDGTWHLFDTMTTMYVYNRASPPHIASCAEIEADNTLMLNAVAEGRACPGFLLCGDIADWYADADQPLQRRRQQRRRPPAGRAHGPAHRPGLQADLGVLANQHPTPRPADTAGRRRTTTRPAGDWKDTVNFPYWEPYDLIQLPTAPSTSTTPRPTAAGPTAPIRLAPDFRSAGYQAMLEPTSTNMATYNDDALTPDLHPATVGTTAEAVFKINVPFYITDANISGDFVQTNAGDICKIYVSTNGTSWTRSGTTAPARHHAA